MKFGKPSHPTVKLSISNKQDFYVEGEAIYGDVVVTSPCVGAQIKCLRVELECTEAVIINRTYTVAIRHQEVTHIDVDNKRWAAGCCSFAYGITVPQLGEELSPSIEVEGEPYCGFTWCVRAIMTIGSEETIKDQVLVKIFPLLSQSALLKAEERRSLGKLRHGCIKVTCDRPKGVQQAPGLFDVVLDIELEKRTFVRSVAVYLEACVIMSYSSQARAQSTYHFLEKVRLYQLIDKLTLSGEARGWKLEGALPPSWNGGLCRSQYDLCVDVKLARGNKFRFRWLDTRVLSPTFRRAVSNAEAKAETKDEAKAEGQIKDAHPPPAYSG